MLAEKKKCLCVCIQWYSGKEFTNQLGMHGRVVYVIDFKPLA
jgi:hypothetical protein